MAFSDINDNEVDAINVEIPQYDEDEEELFTGPAFAGYNEDEFYEQDEYSVSHPELITVSEPPAAQGDGLEPRSAGIASDHTQLGAVPGTTNVEEVVPGGGDIEPGSPPQSSMAMPMAVEFASSGDERSQTPLGDPVPDGALYNPDGSPLDDETELLNELQRVQRDIAHRRADRKRRLEQQLALARLRAEQEEDAIFSAAVSPPQLLVTTTK